MIEGLIGTDWTIPGNFLWLLMLFFGIVFLRYVFLSGLYQQFFFGWFSQRFKSRMLGIRYKQRQVKREILWSGISSFIFAVSGVIMLILWQKGFLKLLISADP